MKDSQSFMKRFKSSLLASTPFFRKPAPPPKKVQRTIATVDKRTGEMTFYFQTPSQMSLERLSEILKSSPDNVHSLLCRADKYIEIRKLPEARHDLNHVLSIEPTHELALLQLAQVESLDGRPKEALKILEKLTFKKGDEKFLMREFIKASAFKKLNDFDASLKAMNLCIELDVERPESFTNRGNLKAEMGDKDGAISDFQMAFNLRKETNIGRAYLRRAMGFHMLHMFAEAEQDLVNSIKAVKNDPKKYSDKNVGNIERYIRSMRNQRAAKKSAELAQIWDPNILDLLNDDE